MSYYDFTKAHSQPLVQNSQSSQPLYTQFDQAVTQNQQAMQPLDIQYNPSSSQTNYVGVSQQQMPRLLQQPPMLPSVVTYKNEDSSESFSGSQSNRKQSMFGADDEASSSDNGKLPKTGPKRRRKPLIKGTEEYKKRRERNNEAVKKSRIKSKEKTCETQEKVSELAAENKMLLDKVSELSKEFELLKDLYQTHSRTTSEPQKIDLSTLLEPTDD